MDTARVEFAVDPESTGDRGAFSLPANIDESLRLQFIPVDGRIAFAVEVFNGRKPPPRNLADGFTGRMGDGSVEITLGHRLLLLGIEG